MQDGMKLRGTFNYVHRDRDGNIIDSGIFHNRLTDTGINYTLNAACHGGAQISAWYFAPFINDYTVLGTETYAAPGYTEATTQYSEATRQEWAEDAAANKEITNSVVARITAAAAVTIYGCGIVGGGTGATTKGDTAGGGMLLALGKFVPGPKALTIGETLDLTYRLGGSSS